MQYPISKITRTELSLVKDLAYLIWPRSYKMIISEGQINYMLNFMYATNRLEKDYDSGHEFYGYFEKERLLGFITYENHHPSHGQMKIHKLYVDTNSSKQGIGNSLVECVKELAIASKINEIVLNVNRKNPAISFYQKINFEIDREEVIDIGEGYIMDDYIMKYTLPC